MDHTKCPCQSGEDFKQCCEPYLRKKLPNTVEALMRSRYTAYRLENWNYIYKTWAKDTRPSLASLRQSDNVTWLGLKVIQSSQTEKSGLVEFIASFKNEQGIHQIHETSLFIKNKDRWVYVDSDFNG